MAGKVKQIKKTLGYYETRELSENSLANYRQGNKFTDRNFRDSYWQPIMDLLNFEHKPHDTRHTCVSLLTEKEVNEKFIRKIVGHKGKTI